MNKVKSWAQMQEDARLAALRSQMQAQQVNQGRMPWGGGQQYAGGSPGFDERTGQAVPESGLARLLMQGKNGLQGAWGSFQDWRNNLAPRANQQYNEYNQNRINRRLGRDGG